MSDTTEAKKETPKSNLDDHSEEQVADAISGLDVDDSEIKDDQHVDDDADSETDDDELSAILDRLSLQTGTDSSDGLIKGIRRSTKVLRQSLRRLFKRRKAEGETYMTIESEIETHGFEHATTTKRVQGKSSDKYYLHDKDTDESSSNVHSNTSLFSHSSKQKNAVSSSNDYAAAQSDICVRVSSTSHPSSTASTTTNQSTPPSETPGSNSQISRRRLPQPPVQDPNVYDFRYSERGYMVILVNEKFMRQNRREGAIYDLAKAKSIAMKLGFRIFNPFHNFNLSKTRTIEVLRQAQRMDHSKFDCFAFLISSHGVQVPNPRLKGKKDHALVCSDDQFIFTSTILQMFSERNCPSLKGKPKLFFIQACRGIDVDEGGDVYVRGGSTVADRASPMWLTDYDGNVSSNKDAFCEDQRERDLNAGGIRTDKRNIDQSDVRHSGDSWARSGTQQYRATAHAQIEEGSLRYIDENSSTSINADQNVAVNRPAFSFDPPRHQYTPNPFPIVDTPVIQCDADFVVMYAIPPGMFAWRNTADGSWMIDYLDQVVKEYDLNRPTNFLFLLTKVTRRMSHRETNAPDYPNIHKKKAITVIENTLTKDIMFERKVDFRKTSHEMIHYGTVV